MELYQWYCPLCGTYHYEHIGYWHPRPCKGCYNEFFVTMTGEVKHIRERGF